MQRIGRQVADAVGLIRTLTADTVSGLQRRMNDTVCEQAPQHFISDEEVYILERLPAVTL